MKRYLICLALVLLAFPGGRLSGQTLYTKAELLSDWAHLCGNGSPYCPPKESLTPSPNGYKPFYLLHIGRHGSRYLNHTEQYENFYHTLLKADSLGEKVVLNARGNLGLLLPRGRREHEGIADRMVSHFPEIFVPGPDDSCHIEVITTHVPRVVESMEAAMGRLRERVPSVALSIHVGGDSATVFKAVTHGKANRFAALRTDFSAYPAPERVTGMLFKEGTPVPEAVRESLLYDFWTVSIGALLADTLGVDLFRYLRPEEIYPLWRQRDAYFYHVVGPARDSLPANRSAFFARMVRCADAAVAGKGHAADLHYAHDGNIFPLECLLDIADCSTPVPEGADVPARVDEYYQDCSACPMGANLQFVFYRKRARGKVLVKILMNEREVLLKDIRPWRGPYYRWKDVREKWVTESLLFVSSQ